MRKEAVFKQAETLMEQERYGEAFRLLSALHAHEPRDPSINFSAGVAARAAGMTGPAVGHLQKAAAVAGKVPTVLENLARAWLDAEDLKEALEAARKAARLTPQDPALQVLLGTIHRKLSRPVMARKAFEAALAIDPAHLGALIGLADLERSLGDFAASEALFRQAIEVRNDTPEAHWGLAQVRKFGSSADDNDPGELQQIEALIAADPARKPHQRARLHWAAGKILHDLGEDGRAFEHFEQARGLTYPRYDPCALEAHFAVLRDTFDAAFFREREALGSSSDKPVFVFGMPRSGTTLVEQIIARQSRAAGAGELSYFKTAEAALGLRPGQDFSQTAAALDEKALRRVGRKYLAVLDSIDARALRVVNKYPHNFQRLWLLALLFPKATFIHCVRSPVDTCLSIMTTPLKRQHNYNRDQASLGHYYRQYHALMEHWRAVLPVTIRHQSYEELVHDQGGQSRDLLAHTGLRWEDGCLDFHKGEGPVTTFSQEQVRQPIYRSSVGRWRRYESRIGPLLDALGDLAPA